MVETIFFGNDQAPLNHGWIWSVKHWPPNRPSNFKSWDILFCRGSSGPKSQVFFSFVCLGGSRWDMPHLPTDGLFPKSTIYTSTKSMELTSKKNARIPAWDPDHGSLKVLAITGQNTCNCATIGACNWNMDQHGLPSRQSSCKRVISQWTMIGRILLSTESTFWKCVRVAMPLIPNPSWMRSHYQT